MRVTRTLGRLRRVYLTAVRIRDYSRLCPLPKAGNLVCESHLHKCPGRLEGTVIVMPSRKYS